MDSNTDGVWTPTAGRADRKFVWTQKPGVKAQKAGHGWLWKAWEGGTNRKLLGGLSRWQSDRDRLTICVLVVIRWEEEREAKRKTNRKVRGGGKKNRNHKYESKKDEIKHSIKHSFSREIQSSKCKKKRSSKRKQHDEQPCWIFLWNRNDSLVLAALIFEVIWDETQINTDYRMKIYSAGEPSAFFKIIFISLRPYFEITFKSLRQSANKIKNKKTIAIY